MHSNYSYSSLKYCFLVAWLVVFEYFENKYFIALWCLFMLTFSESKSIYSNSSKSINSTFLSSLFSGCCIRFTISCWAFFCRTSNFFRFSSSSCYFFSSSSSFFSLILAIFSKTRGSTCAFFCFDAGAIDFPFSNSTILFLNPTP